MIPSPNNSTADGLSRQTVLLLLGLILIVGAALRFFELDTVPPGLWFDEALKAQDALATAQGHPHLIYVAEFPREPLFIWYHALVSLWISEEIPAHRAASGVIGMITLLVFFICVRRCADVRLALLATAVLATMRWHVLFSRLLFRTLLMPLLMTLIVWAAYRAREKRSWPRAALFGAIMGAGFYTYLSWYFMLPGILVLFWWVFKESDKDRHIRKLAAICAGAGLLVAGPMLYHYAMHPEHILLRPAAVLPSRVGDKSALAEITENFIQSLGMFNYEGDYVARQNYPKAPGLDVVAGVFFLIGLVACAVQTRRRSPFAIIILAWLFSGMLPTILTWTDSPNFLRTLVLTPALAAITAMGLSAAWDGIVKVLPGRKGLIAAIVLTAAALTASTAFTARDMFWRIPQSVEVWAAFNGGECQLGRAAAETPDDASFWVPDDIGQHRSFRYLARNAKALIPFRDFKFLRPDPWDPHPKRWIVATAHNQIYVVLDRFVPAARMIEEFKRPDGVVWALLYEVPVSGLPPEATVDAFQKSHPVQNLGF